MTRSLLLTVLLLFGLKAEFVAQTNSLAPRTFATRGLVREKPADGKTVVVRHEEIPGYMPKMTMELIVKDLRELQSISEGDIITFNLVVSDEDHFIEKIRRVGVSTETNAPVNAVKTSPHTELKVGDAMPEIELLDENGRKIKLSDFRGSALAFTFIFSRCPLPDYCPRMNKHFQRAREILLQNSSGITNWQFLSISFDPDFDKPAVLKNYGNSYRSNNADHWLFAAISPELLADIGPRLDFRFSRDAGSFSHNLRTVVVDSKGRIFKQFDNNLWTAEDLANAMEAAAK